MAYSSMTTQRGKLVSGGRLQLPAEMRRELGLSDGDGVVMKIVDGVIEVRPLKDAISRVQNRLREFAGPGPERASVDG
mgnify:CR=1 FL=1